MFYLENIENKKILKSDTLGGLTHFFTTRESNIEDNIDIVSQYLGIQPYEFAHAKQTHSANIKVAQKGAYYVNVDAFIVNEPDVAVYMNYADCTPVILFDEKKNVAAIAHAGWRGTADAISQKVAVKMIEEFGCSPADISAAIGPAIDDCCYDIWENGYEMLKKTIDDDSQCFRFEDDKIYTNLKLINYRQLSSLGIKNIDICNYCTCCNNELFFSYRKENTEKRQNAVVKLK